MIRAPLWRPAAAVPKALALFRVPDSSRVAPTAQTPTAAALGSRSATATQLP